MIIDKIKNVLKRFPDANLCSDAAREIISVHIYNELIVNDAEDKYIYESPDGGNTVYRRKFGEMEREKI